MNTLLYIFRFIYRLRYWIIFCPIVVAYLIYVFTGRISRAYDVKTTIYTGVVSGFDIESGGGDRQDWNTVNNSMDNLINIISAQTTLKRVSMRLYAQHMMKGNPNKDNNYISAKNYNAIYQKTPEAVRKLIDKGSEERTLENLYNYERANSANFVYGLFNWTHRHYSYEALSKVSIRRLGSSDMLEIRYTADDPGIAYNTLVLLNEEFVQQYEDLRFGQTNNVIVFFEQELARLAGLLNSSEDSLINYNVDKRVINYFEQTKFIASMGRDFELKYEDILLTNKGSEKLVSQLESRLKDQAASLRNNGIFIQKMASISELSSRIAAMESFEQDSMFSGKSRLDGLRAQLSTAEEELSTLAQQMSQGGYTQEGLAFQSLISQWLTEVIRFEKSRAEMAVMEERKTKLDSQYTFFSPIGSTLKRKEREIGFTEQSYLTVLNSLNAARLRQKNLQMTSATLKVMNPPVYPISPMPTKRKLMVAAGFFGTLFFLLGSFLIIELLDRTLRDKVRTELMTKGKVIGAFPRAGKLRHRIFAKQWNETAAKNISNSLAGYFKPIRTNIVNVLSAEEGDNKLHVAEQLSEFWESVGVNTKILVAGEDFSVSGRNFYMAQDFTELCSIEAWELVIVVYPSLTESAVPQPLLQQACINLMSIRANRPWKDTDQLLFEKLTENVGQAPLFILLTQADKWVVEAFTGLLPPFTLLSKMGYRFCQFGLTSSEK